MATSKPEKINITISKPARKGPSVTKPVSLGTARSEDVADFDGGFSEAMSSPGETVHPRPQQDAEPEPVSEPVSASDLPDSSKDEVGDYPGLESEDFYSSKFNHELTHHGSAPKIRTASKRLVANNLRFWFILSIFLLTLAASLTMLYQLEQAQSGAGLIFEWF